MYNQNQEDILNYAHNIIENGFPKGILMIDDNWQRYYGNFEFKAEKFPDARAMTDELHRLGFKVMLWISPFVSADSPEFRDLAAKGFLLKNKNGTPAVVNWWNGYSACYDMTNPAAVESLKQTLNECMGKYGIDGFKFDAGDIAILANGEYDYYDKNADQNIFSQRWAELGLSYPFNEFRAAWKTGGPAISATHRRQRLFVVCRIHAYTQHGNLRYARLSLCLSRYDRRWAIFLFSRY